MQTIVMTLTVTVPFGIDNMASAAQAAQHLNEAAKALGTDIPDGCGLDVELSQYVRQETDGKLNVPASAPAAPKAPRKPRAVKAKAGESLPSMTAVGEDSPAPTLAEQVIAENAQSAPAPAWKTQAEAAPAADPAAIPAFLKRA